MKLLTTKSFKFKHKLFRRYYNMKIFLIFQIFAVCYYGTSAQELLLNSSHDFVPNTVEDFIVTLSHDYQPEIDKTETPVGELSKITTKISDEVPDNITIKFPGEEPISVTTKTPDEKPVPETSKIPDVPVNCTTKAPIIDEKIVGMNIGLFYVLEELKRKIDFGHHPTELLIKALVISQKIERHHGDLISLNKERMKVLARAVPSSFKEAVCTE